MCFTWTLWVLQCSHKTKLCHPGWQMGEEQAGAVGHPGPGDHRHVPFQDPESFSVSPETLQVNCVRMGNLVNVGHWQQELMGLPWSYLHVKPLIFSFGMLWFPSVQHSASGKLAEAWAYFHWKTDFHCSWPFLMLNALVLMNQHFPMEKHSFGEFPGRIKPRFNTLQNPSRTAFILYSCTYKQFYSSLVSLYYNKITTQIQISHVKVFIVRITIFATGKIMRCIDI